MFDLQFGLFHIRTWSKCVPAKMHATFFSDFHYIVGFGLIEVNTLFHCSEVEKGVGEDMIHILDAIMKICSWADINSNLQFSYNRPSFQIVGS
jgi:hypothetical protein